jgi:hypothetical protein
VPSPKSSAAVRPIVFVPGEATKVTSWPTISDEQSATAIMHESRAASLVTGALLGATGTALPHAISHAPTIARPVVRTRDPGTMWGLVYTTDEQGLATSAVHMIG